MQPPFSYTCIMKLPSTAVRREGRHVYGKGGFSMQKQISRRSFLKGITAGTAGAAAAHLFGAASAVMAEEENRTVTVLTQKEESAFSPASEDHTYGSFINPQKELESKVTEFPHLFSPLKIGGITMKNRIMKSAAGSEMQDNNEWPSEAAFEYYGSFARGGVGMICYESSTIFPMNGAPMLITGIAKDAAAGSIPGAPEGMGDMPVMFSLDISSDEGIPAHKAVADYLHGLDTPVIAQMVDMMMLSGASSTDVHATDLETSFANGKMQSTEEVQQEIQCFIDAAERYYKAGYDGVEINASCNHYFSTFLSRFANHERTDQYSGETLENRARVITEIIEGIRERVGADFVIQVLYSGVEENVGTLGDNDGCTTIEEACEFAKIFEKAGASSLHIRSQAYGHHCGGFMPDVFHIGEHGHTGYGTVIDYGKHFSPVSGDYNGYGALLEVAAKIKECVSIPVGAVGAMDPRITPDLIENAIADGKIDFILMTRPLMADPQYCNKLKEGRMEDIAPCTRCMTCFVAPFGFGIPMYCRVNASLTRAFTPDMPEGYDPLPAEETKKVLVIGGGPSGMEAARICAQRGHEVTLLEKEDALGTTMDTLQLIKGPHERIEEHKAYLIRQVYQEGVEVITGQEARTDMVKEIAPDIIIVAAGSRPSMPDVPGMELAADVHSLAGEISGEEFVVLGAQFQGCEAAVNLARRGKKVTVVNPESADMIYQNGSVWPKMMNTRWLKAKGVKFYNNAVIEKIAPDGVTITSSIGLSVFIPADQVINALPREADRTLFDELQGVCGHIVAVGDCYAPGTIANGIARANLTARNIERISEAAVMKDGAGEVYTASASGIGEVKVSIRVENGTVTEVMVDTSGETAGIGKDLGDAFAQQILEKGAIDEVSGATITSGAVREAYEECLKLAGL